MKVDVGQKLFEASLIREDDLKRAQKIEKDEGASPTTTLVKLGAISEDRLLAVHRPRPH